MSNKTIELSLTDILRSATLYSFLEEVSQMKNEKLLHHDVLKINKVLDGIKEYLIDLNSVFDYLTNSEKSEDIESYFHARDVISEIESNLNSTDGIVSQILTKLDLDNNKIHLEPFLSKCDEISDALLRARSMLILLKKRVSASLGFKELKEYTLALLEREVDDCSNTLFEIVEKGFSSPAKQLANFDLDDITSRMKVNDVSMDRNFRMERIRLPTFNDFDESIYNNYTDLKVRSTPLEISIDYLPVRIEHFHALFGALFPRASQIIDKCYTQLIAKWKIFLSEQKKLKETTLDAKWLSIFSYLVNEIHSKCDSLILEVKKELKVTDEIASLYKLCSNTITLISKAFHERLVYNDELFKRFNETLIPKWNELTRLLSSLSQDPDSPVRTTSQDGYRQFKVKKMSKDIPLRETNTNRGNGIDFHLGIKTTEVPFSISKSDRIKDLVGSGTTFKGKSLKKDFEDLVYADLKYQPADLDELTLINKTPKVELDLNKPDLTRQTLDEIEKRPHEKFPIKNEPNINIENLHSLPNCHDLGAPSLDNNLPTKGVLHANPTPYPNDVTLDKLFDSKHLLDTLMIDSHNMPSNIPIIVANYFDKGLPVLKKKFSGHTKIPSISPNHWVFQSPQKIEHRPQTPVPPGQYIRLTSSLRSPIRLTFKETDIFRRPLSRQSSISLSSMSSRPGSSLGMTPDLSFRPTQTRSRTPSIQSRSPDRPPSSIGSRFDEEHLLQPIKNQRPLWK